MNQQTNQQPVTAADMNHLVSFLSEAMWYVDLYTPTLIDGGGCGVFAELLSEQLFKLGVEHTIVGLFKARDKDRISHLISINNGGKDDPEESIPSHIVVQIGDLPFDNNGMVLLPVLKYAKRIPLTMDALHYLADQSRGWNSVFDRECIPIIKQKMEEVFSQYEQYTPGYFYNQIPDKYSLVMSNRTIAAKTALTKREAASVLANRSY